MHGHYRSISQFLRAVYIFIVRGYSSYSVFWLISCSVISFSFLLTQTSRFLRFHFPESTTGLYIVNRFLRNNIFVGMQLLSPATNPEVSAAGKPPFSPQTIVRETVKLILDEKPAAISPIGDDVRTRAE